MPLPIRSKNPPESLPIATCLLIFVNVLVYAVTSNGFIAHKDVVMNWGLKGSQFDPLHTVTSMFLHGSLLHLLGNMWFLYLFGFAVEGRMKTPKFLLAYFSAGFIGAILHQLVSSGTDSKIPMIGASGAIMGVMGAALYLFPYAQVTVIWRFMFQGGITDWPMWGIGCYYLAFDLLWAFIGIKDGVAHFVHIGGAIGGVLAVAVFRPKRDNEQASEAKAVLADAKDYGILSRRDLVELHRVNPTDSLIVLHWMTKSLRESQGPNQECIDAFIKAVPVMLNTFDVRTVAQCMIPLSDRPGVISARMMLDAAGRVERANDHLNASRMYEIAWKMVDATEDDQQGAIFRHGMLAESAHNNLYRAAQCYEEILNKWPMGHFAGQARGRLAVIGPKLSAQMAATQGAPPRNS